MELALPLPVRGLILGFTIAAAVGPISLLTIRRTLAHGHVYGLVSGLGVAAADGTYAAIAAFGLTALTGLLVSGRMLLGVIGGLIIVWLGIRTMRSRPAELRRDPVRPGLVPAFASIYGLTMTNPMTILSFAALFAGIGLLPAGGAALPPGATGASFVDAAVLTVAVFVGSTLWWVLLTGVVAWARERVSMAALFWVNRIAGVVLVVLGAIAVAASLT